MHDTTAILQRKINSAGDLASIVSTMKALAASSIGQYEKSVRALDQYFRTVELGLGACFRELRQVPMDGLKERAHREGSGAIVFGSDQGLVGQYNDVLTAYVLKTLAALPGDTKVWAVGQRIHARLKDAGLKTMGIFDVPSSVGGISVLVGQIQLESEAFRAEGQYSEVYVFHNAPRTGALYEPVSQKLLPLDQEWQLAMANVRWPTSRLAEVVGGTVATLPALIREFIYISLFRACAESLASENASRLLAMQRAEKNIAELVEDLNTRFHHLRQSGIDEELFDVISGFESLAKEKNQAR